MPSNYGFGVTALCELRSSAGLFSTVDRCVTPDVLLKPYGSSGFTVLMYWALDNLYSSAVICTWSVDVQASI